MRPMRELLGRLLLLGIVSGCSTHAAIRPKTAEPALPSERVVGRAEWLDIQLAPTAYRHLGADPQAGPWRVLFSEQHHYCPVADSTYVIVQDGTLFPCEWRAIRP